VIVHNQYVTNLYTDQCLINKNTPDSSLYLNIHSVRLDIFFVYPISFSLSPLYSAIYLLRYFAVMAQLDAWFRCYATSIALSNRNLGSEFSYDRILQQYVQLSDRYSTYEGLNFTHANDQLSTITSNWTVTYNIALLSGSADSLCCNISKPCLHLNCLNFHPLLRFLKESFAGALILSHFLTPPFDQLERLVNVTTMLMSQDLQVRLVQVVSGSIGCALTKTKPQFWPPQQC